MKNILQITNQLLPADVIIAKKRNGFGRFLDHYIVYLGNNIFIGNLKDGVKIVPQFELLELLQEYEPVKIRPFEGTDFERLHAIKRAKSKLNERYSLLTFNCEHFANWVQIGKINSTQVSLAIIIILLGGFTYNLFKSNNTKN
jgi:hypothetical protein